MNTAKMGRQIKLALIAGAASLLIAGCASTPPQQPVVARAQPPVLTRTTRTPVWLDRERMPVEDNFYQFGYYPAN